MGVIKKFIHSIPALDEFFRREEVKALLKNWHWLLVGALFALALCELHLQTKWFSYKQSAVILSRAEKTDVISTNKKIIAGSDAIDAMQAYNAVNSLGNIVNIQMMIQSRRLIKHVVDSLDLQTSYIGKDGWRKVLLYEDRPFTVRFHCPRGFSGEFDVKVCPNGKLKLSHFYTITSEGEVDFEKEIPFDTPVATPMGKLIVERSDSVKHFIGQTIHVERMSREDAIMSFFKRITADRFDRTSLLLRVNCLDHNPYRATDIVNTLIGVFHKDVLDYKNNKAETMSRYVHQRIDTLSVQVADVQAQLSQFQKDHKVMAYENSLKEILKQSNKLEENIHALESESAIVGQVKRYMDDPTHDMDLIPMLNGMDQATMLAVYGYNTLLNQYMRLYKPENSAASILKDFDRDLKARRKAIGINVTNKYNSIQILLEKYRRNYDRLQNLMEISPEGMSRYVDLKRELKILNKLYLYELNLREEVNMQLALGVQSIRVVEGPSILAFQPLGNPSANRFTAVILGLFIMGFIIVYRVRKDISVKTVHEIEQASSLPIIGRIYQIPGVTEESMYENDKRHIYSPVLESFRLLRYNLDRDNSHGNVIMLTSSSPGQGKSFVSRNLGKVCGMTGKRVVLIDADIRKLTQSKVTNGMHHTLGLTDFLQDEHLSPDKIILKNGLSDGADFIAGGVIPPNPAELLMRPRLKELIDWLKEHYDYVIIDTTPAFSVTDAQTVGHHADVTLYVIRLGVENRYWLPNLDRMAQEEKFRNVHIVINGIPYQN